MDTDTALLATAFVALVALILLRWYTSPYRIIPTVGGTSLPLLSYVTTFNHLSHSPHVIREGYDKYRGSAFKAPFLDQWVVMVSGPRLVDELRRRPESELSLATAITEMTQFRYTVGKDSLDDPYHVGILREKLPRALPKMLPDIVDEMALAIDEYIPTTGRDWTSVDIGKALYHIISRANNRAFVGVPLCRNKDYLNLATAFSRTVEKAMFTMAVVPTFLRPLFSPLVTKVEPTVAKALVHAQPLINERKANMAKCGENWPDRPDDLLQWLLEKGIQRGSTDANVLERLLLVNFAAIHTTTYSLTHAVYHLAELPDLQRDLREEAELVIDARGWDYAAAENMWKLDSFLKESQRWNGISVSSLSRTAMQDVTLSDGTLVPQGTLVLATAHAIHHDEHNYPNPYAFDPFRFSRLREKGGEGNRHQFTTTSLDYLAWGHGYLACPGRFFASGEMKLFLAHVLLNYDLKLGGDGTRPKNIQVGHMIAPAANGHVLFKRRGSTDLWEGHM